tara:strand:+ start:1361 stop:2062 length:702 start_codon:yes stop_codon:yes gene_type:complete
LNKIGLIFFGGIILVSFLACGPQLKVTSKPVDIEKNIEADGDLSNFILPYSAELDVKMNVKIAESKHDFIVARPSSNLMNWTADAVFYNQTRNKKLSEPTFCLLNFGGIRSSIGKGDIKLKDLYKVMPFDNSIVWVKLPISALQKISVYLKSSGGEPISNVQMQSGKLILNGDQETDFFWVITSDYLYHGGDHMDFFQESIEVIETKTLIRDALIEEAKFQKVLVNDTTTRIL